MKYEPDLTRGREDMLGTSDIGRTDRGSNKKDRSIPNYNDGELKMKDYSDFIIAL